MDDVTLERHRSFGVRWLSWNSTMSFQLSDAYNLSYYFYSTSKIFFYNARISGYTSMLILTPPTPSRFVSYGLLGVLGGFFGIEFTEYEARALRLPCEPHPSQRWGVYHMNNPERCALTSGVTEYFDGHSRRAWRSYNRRWRCMALATRFVALKQRS